MVRVDMLIANSNDLCKAWDFFCGNRENRIKNRDTREMWLYDIARWYLENSLTTYTHVRSLRFCKGTRRHCKSPSIVPRIAIRRVAVNTTAKVSSNDIPIQVMYSKSSMPKYWWVSKTRRSQRVEFWSISNSQFQQIYALINHAVC